MIIDAHTHVWQPVAGDAGTISTIVSPQSEISPELLGQYLQEHGIERAVLVQPVYPGEDNSYVADATARQPDRFAAVCVVDPRKPDAAERLRYWVKERGCRGLRLRPRIAEETAAFDAPATGPLWKEMESLGVAVDVLAGSEHLPMIAAIARRYPSVPILIDHFAHPATSGSAAERAAGLISLASCPEIYVKLSGYYYFSREAYPYRDCWDMVRAVYDAFGPARLLWGSDFPHVLLKTGYGRNLRLANTLLDHVDAAERKQILGGNAARLYWPQTSGVQGAA